MAGATARGRGLALLRGAPLSRAAPVVGVVGWRQVSSGAAKWQCDGSLTAGDAAWTWATKPCPPSMAWHANRPGPWPGALMGRWREARRGEPGGSRRGDACPRGQFSPGVGGGAPGALGAGPSRPRPFASWQQKMDGWEAPRREGNQGRRGGAAARRGGRAPPCVGPRGALGGPRPLWLAWRMAWRMARFAGRRPARVVEHA